LLDADARLLVAVPSGGFVQTDDLLVPEGARATDDPFIASAATSNATVLSDDARRGAVRIPGQVGETRYIIDVRSATPLETPDIFAMGLLAQYVAVAARNVELYGELQARRSAVVELNEVKNDLIAMLAHDFKGPLTTIVGFADVLAEDDRFDEESRKFLAMISSSAMRLASLATDTLALSRLEQNELTLNIEPFDLVALVGDIVRVFSVTRQIDLVSDRAQLTIAGDPARLRQVFENLIGNAIKYSPNGEPVEVKLKAKGRGVEVAVRDQGIGIPDADRPKLFGRFARAQNARAMGIGGTGFGLYLTKTIVEMHGGTIGVESKEGRGSTFRVFVPASAALKRPQHRRFILLDSAGDARSYVAHTLRDDGYSVTVVGDGDALLAQVDEIEFDAALVDTDRVGMPLEEFVRRVAGRTALIRIDGSAVDEVPGWDGYLIKPFLTKDLRAAIEAAIMRHPRRKPDAVLTYAKGSAGA
jgi:signal transduction histidine kinase/CheY-like chemotaxis protein